MGNKILIFGDIEIEKDKFYGYKSPTFFYFFLYIDVYNILISKKIYFGKKNFKYFVGFLYDDYKIKPLHIKL